MQKFQAHLQRGGTGLKEMRRLLEAFSQHGDLERLKEQVFKENLLGKTSDHLLKDLFSAFKRRFLQQLGYPPVEIIAEAMISTISEAGKIQILFPYFVHSDPLVEEVYLKLVVPRSDSINPHLSRDEVLSYLQSINRTHPELKAWSEYLCLRWSRGFLALLRHFGLMERHPSNKIKRLWLLLDSFTFFWLWFWQQGGSFWDAEKNDLWILLQLQKARKSELLAEGQLRGWWTYQRSGEIVQFQPKFKSVEDWLRNGLA